MSIYTRTGDTGTTALFGGKRVPKNTERVEAYGSVDELNSWIGLLSSKLEIPDVQEFLGTIQADLFTMGSVLSGWQGNLDELPKRVTEMEARIDAMEKELPEIRNFIIPGGTELASFAQIGRAVARRAERHVVALSQKEPVDSRIIKYLNRLSTLFFMLARFINKKSNITEVSWSGIKK